jgi:plastocyanin
MFVRKLVGPAMVCAVALVPLAACGGKSKSSATTAAQAATTAAGSATTAASATTSATGDQLAIQGFAFSPDKLTVKAGTKLTVQNKDAANHTFTSDDGKTFNMPVNSHATVTVTVSAPGTYTYHCRIHPSMKGTLTVT